jgi:hypothetical protein
VLFFSEIGFGPWFSTFSEIRLKFSVIFFRDWFWSLVFNFLRPGLMYTGTQLNLVPGTELQPRELPGTQLQPREHQVNLNLAGIP